MKTSLAGIIEGPLGGTRVASYLPRHRLSILGALIIAGVVFLTYFPALGIGFWTDDYLALDAAGRFSGLAYLAKFFDPRLQRFWYRPMVGIQWKIEYLLFRGEAVGYHLVQVAFHLLVCLLLYLLVTRVTGRWRIGFIAGLIYATLSLASQTVYWTAVHDPLAGIWGLLAILLWMEHVETGGRLKAVLAWIAFAGALLSKEINVILLPLLFLADRLLINRSITWQQLIRRYIPLAVLLLIYGLLQLVVVTKSVFTQQIGYSIGPHMIDVFLRDLSLLAFPQQLDNQWLQYGILSLAAVLVFYISFKRDRKLVFLAASAILPVLVIMPIPPHLFNPRYLYLPLMASAAGFSLLIEMAVGHAAHIRPPLLRTALGIVLVAVVMSGGMQIGERVENFGGFIRQVRLKFRPIFQDHVTFPADSFLYFIDTPLQTQDISGLMFLHYGGNVSVGGVDRKQVESLKSHAAAYVCYLDDQDVFKTQPVDKNAVVQSMPVLPALFQDSLSLDRVDLANIKAKPGQTLVVILYWHAVAKVDKDYTVFIHLLDKQGRVVAGLDAQPRKGLMPTSSWLVNDLVPDGFAIPIDRGIVPGDYVVELGFYDFASMQRLELTGNDGLPVGDKVLLGPVQIGE